MNHAIWVNKTNLRQTRQETAVPEATLTDLAPDQALLEVQHFALTANNLTYAVFGDAMKYWDFFPTTDPAWGQIPVWGFAKVQALGDELKSQDKALTVGEVLYGYFPMASHLVITPTRVNQANLMDGAAHRAHLHPVYNQYRRCAADIGYQSEREAQQMLAQPLFMTGFLIDDFLADNHFFGAEQVVITSASSKTSYSLAHCLRERSKTSDSKTPKVIGLTSVTNAVFVNALACYDQVLTYDQVTEIQTKSSVLVDMAGNSGLRSNIHRHFGEDLKYSCAVGGTHWEQTNAGGSSPKKDTAASVNDTPAEKPKGIRPTLFFAPAQVKKRSEEWGPAGLAQRMGAAWLGFQSNLDDWMHIVHANGTQATIDHYQRLVDGQAKADQGIVLSLSRS